ncbi:hypothetical protein WN55_11070 [Dufourea novaeangliae]|uniref:Uncharacterized protein n=1 Tax=Dufourea novaeangliae TaxID=178035 RepID=A0A154PDR6_DUFNO|nr:hypothetical protein WN55_11070 [Dufourea novaeangliae]
MKIGITSGNRVMLVGKGGGRKVETEGEKERERERGKTQNVAVRFEAVLALLPARTAKHQPRAAPPPPPRETSKTTTATTTAAVAKKMSRGSPLEEEERAEARAYILDLGGWKSEIAPYRAVRRDQGGAL